MATKIDPKAKNVEAAIRSLYDLFPAPNTRYGCSDLKTKEIVALNRKIEARHKELKAKLDADASLVKMRAELKKLQCDTVARANKLHRGVDELLRQFQVRGVSDDLLERVEELSKETPIILDDCSCIDDDSED